MDSYRKLVFPLWRDCRQHASTTPPTTMRYVHVRVEDEGCCNTDEICIGVNSYEWGMYIGTPMQKEPKLRQSTGKVGKESAAAKFATATPSDDFSIEEEKPYAEVGY